LTQRRRGQRNTTSLKTLQKMFSGVLCVSALPLRLCVKIPSRRGDRTAGQRHDGTAERRNSGTGPGRHPVASGAPAEHTDKIALLTAISTRSAALRSEIRRAEESRVAGGSRSITSSARRRRAHRELTLNPAARRSAGGAIVFLQRLVIPLTAGLEPAGP
jgi:hypothetical protein